MIPFRINKEKFNIPTCWDDVSFSHYMTLLTLPNSFVHYVSLFTGIPVETLANADIKGIEKLGIALSFLNVATKFDSKPTAMVGKYHVPKDITVESLGQFEALRDLLKQSENDIIKINELYLKAVAIYCQKLRDGKFDITKVIEVEAELRNHSCVEVIQTGAFFLFKQQNILMGIRPRSRNILQRLKKLIVELPGYQKTLDSLLPSSGKVKE
jgi:hypothetical protein